MRNLLYILSFFLIGQIFAQPFSHSGSVLGPNDNPISGVPVNLYKKRYAVYSITYPTYLPEVFNLGTIIPSSDDATHGPFPIGFTFTFFGVQYTQFYVGSNGWIGFSSGQTTGYTAAYIPNSGSPRNTILADWEDLYPGSSNIYYRTIGTIPNRKLIVSFYNVPHYSCRTQLHSFQFILTEGANTIDVNYANKPLCSGNNATAGLVAPTYTTTVPLDGKNASLWSVSNYSVRYSPQSPDSAFTFHGTYLTNSLGNFSIVPNLDMESYEFQLRVENVPVTLTNTECLNPFFSLLSGLPLNYKTYYTLDVNSDEKLTISDCYLLFGRVSGRFESWIQSPNYRLFNQTDWNQVKTLSGNPKTSFPGTQKLIITPVNGGNSVFYLIRTGFLN